MHNIVAAFTKPSMSPSVLNFEILYAPQTMRFHCGFTCTEKAVGQPRVDFFSALPI